MEHLFEQETEDKGLKEDEMYPQAAVIDKKDLSQDDVLDDNPPQKKMKFINKSAVISEDPRYQGKKVTLKEIEDQTETVNQFGYIDILLASFLVLLVANLKQRVFINYKIKATHVQVKIV